ncbi:aminoacyl-histidine dipeptidase [Luxibacter massiliensis]|uniref:aminoacyl-histidine dipeptidase n=1 Tax=Luxibacter massiliensis TaxID=2219695 RepID=UPI000F04C95A|nr:aminoacyl-histidine dipeptidase [Luxibacter massiliensis]
MPILEELEPKEVFHYFEELTRIPRGTFNTKAVSDYCVKFAEERGLEAIQDTLNNVIIKKPGTEGYEESEPIIIQGHLDMVCEKTPESVHDFTKDPLKLYIEDGFVKARDTTLGADDGIAVAMAMALLDSQDIPHPPLEAIFTVDEEVGMGGAEGIDLSPLNGRMLLNLDSDCEDTIIAGCAGGLSFRMNLPVGRKTVAGSCLDVRIHGLKGGHSGIEIDQQRGNANKLAGRLLNRLNQNMDIFLADIKGGAKDNVIPSSCSFTIIVHDSIKAEMIIENMLNTWKMEFGADEPELDITVEKTENVEKSVLSDADMRKVVFFIANCPDGVNGFSRSLKGLVESSDNLGVITSEENMVSFVLLIRSSVSSKLEEIKEALNSWTEFLGGTCELSGAYPAWMYKENSKIRPIVAEVFEKVYGKEPKISTVHAGLECGLLSGKKPELDCVSFGPNMYDIHSVNERLDIASTWRTWNMLKEILKECK